jgi:hypothetical protein
MVSLAGHAVSRTQQILAVPEDVTNTFMCIILYQFKLQDVKTIRTVPHRRNLSQAVSFPAFSTIQKCTMFNTNFA